MGSLPPWANATVAPMADQLDTDALVRYMPILVKDGDVDEWERKFCASIIRQNRGSAFSPSKKQIGVMRRLVDKFRKRAMAETDDDGWQVIE